MGSNITDSKVIQKKIYSYYKQLFGRRERSRLRLGDTAWGQNFRLAEADVEWITRPFTIKELKKSVLEMKADTAPDI